MNNKINILPSSIFNYIAAGEVVERPSSVVKELVENSVDSGAKKIKIDIEDGGIKLVRVTDDGCGIAKEYIKNAFLPHATSKIKDVEDLECITTLGFRGEALASIAAVSMVNIKTKTEESDLGTELNVKGGIFSEVMDCVYSKGTVISMENLFYNTPARIKFLKKQKTEENYITNTVINLILSNPYVSIDYNVNGKNMYKSRGNGLKSAIESIYNKEIITNLIPIENTSGQFAVTGFISNPQYSKPNRSYQTLMINGRTIQNKDITSAVEKAYEQYTMRRHYPMFVINLTIPYDFVDVNVHPSKAEVRFQNSGMVYGFVFKSVVQTLANINRNINEFSFDADDKAFKKENICDTSIKEDFSSSIKSDYLHEMFDDNSSLQKNHGSGLNFTSVLSKNRSRLNDGGISYDLHKISEQNKAYTERNTKIIDTQNSITPLFKDCNIIGQLFSTFILVEQDDCAYLIDQHAVHEKMIYDRLCDNKSPKAIQPLLIPYIIELNQKEFSYIENIMPQISEIGFDIETFGKSAIKVSSVPSELSEIDLKMFFDGVLTDISGNAQIKTADVLADKLKQTACKSAIKGGDTLTREQIQNLLNVMDNSKKFPMQCPHGRPAIIKITKKEIDKWFKRIVE